MQSGAQLPTRIAWRSAVKVFQTACLFLTLLLFVTPQSASAQTQIDLGLSSPSGLGFASTGSGTVSRRVAHITLTRGTDSRARLGRPGLNLSAVGIPAPSSAASGSIIFGSIESPEPMTFLLFGGGLLLVAGIVRRHLRAT